VTTQLQLVVAAAAVVVVVVVVVAAVIIIIIIIITNSVTASGSDKGTPPSESVLYISNNAKHLTWKASF